MTSRPRLLDLFCGAGGAAVGYYRAGFDVVGVDINPQPRYPFEFHQADALDVLRAIVADGWTTPFDVIHASPPCQAHSKARAIRGRSHPELIEPTRELLRPVGVPYVIENVEGAPLRRDIMLCGTMFSGLGVPGRGELRRHRIFEVEGFPPPFLMSPCSHHLRSIGVYGHTGHKTNRGPGVSKSGNHGWLKPDWEQAMGIDWMSRDELAQAIPPAFTEHIGLFLIQHLEQGVAA